MAPVGFLETGVLYCDDNLQRLSQLARTQLLGDVRDVRDVEGVTAAADGAVLPVAVEAAASGPSVWSLVRNLLMVATCDDFWSCSDALPRWRWRVRTLTPRLSAHRVRACAATRSR
ncbi:MAG: hypothetical protein ACR2K4_05965 [Candidatus Limnocylindria bacterium]